MPANKQEVQEAIHDACRDAIDDLGTKYVDDLPEREWHEAVVEALDSILCGNRMMLEEIKAEEADG